MSSHHIVRDEQEPALLIADPSALSLEYVEHLLEWSPTVIVTESALKEVLKWGIKIDVVVAAMSSLEQLKPGLQEQSPVQLLGFESDDLLACAYIFLVDKSYHAVNVLADIYNSAVLDLSKSFKASMDSIIFYNDQKWSYIHSGAYSKWVTTGHHIGIHPVAANTFFRSEGFYTDWENEMLLEPIELTAEITGKVTLQTNSKPLWVVEEVSIDVYK
ncbi:MAG: thiamine diphosphokinase [Roseivirga sp.]